MPVLARKLVERCWQPYRAQWHPVLPTSRSVRESMQWCVQPAADYLERKHWTTVSDTEKIPGTTIDSAGESILETGFSMTELMTALKKLK